MCPNMQRFVKDKACNVGRVLTDNDAKCKAIGIGYHVCQRKILDNFKKCSIWCENSERLVLWEFKKKVVKILYYICLGGC